jgi:hypothetical protein
MRTLLDVALSSNEVSRLFKGVRAASLHRFLQPRNGGIDLQTPSIDQNCQPL